MNLACQKTTWSNYKRSGIWVDPPPCFFFHFEDLDSSSLNKCHKPPGQAVRSSKKQGYAHLNLDNSSLNKCPKLSGQGFRPLPPPKKKRTMPKCRGHQTKWVLPIGQWHIVVLHGDIIYDIIYDNSSWSELHWYCSVEVILIDTGAETTKAKTRAKIFPPTHSNIFYNTYILVVSRRGRFLKQIEQIEC